MSVMAQRSNMTAEGAENKYNTPGGQFDVPDKLSLGDFDKKHQTAGADDSLAKSDSSGDEPDSIIDGLYEKGDSTPTPLATTDLVATPDAETTPAAITEPKLDLASRLDPTKPMALLKLFGDLIITHEANTQMPDTRLDPATAKVDAVADEDHFDTYNGNEKTQEALASVGKVVPRDSEIPDRLLQTLDRLNRQMPNSHTA